VQTINGLLEAGRFQAKREPKNAPDGGRRQQHGRCESKKAGARPAFGNLSEDAKISTLINTWR
jgi:hypothetical protein